MKYLTYRHRSETKGPCARVFDEDTRDGTEWERWFESDFVVEARTGRVVKNRWGPDMIPYGEVQDSLPLGVDQLLISLWIVLALMEQAEVPPMIKKVLTR